MSSPQETTSDGTRKNVEQITFRFCSECSNMLYPKEDPDSHKLQFTCRTCQYTEEATSTCVFRNLMNNAVGETAGVTQDVGSDPTVSIPSPAVSLPVAPQEAAPQAGHTASNPRGEYTGEYLAVDIRASDGETGHSPTPSATEDANNGRTIPHFYLMDRDFAGAIRSVVATSIYNCLDPDHQRSLDHLYVENLVSDTAFNLNPPWGPNYLQPGSLQEDDADPPEALGEEPRDAELEYLL
ncbi:hypothetical protein SCARD494_13644 [Seiridium cardinale]